MKSGPADSKTQRNNVLHAGKQLYKVLETSCFVCNTIILILLFLSTFETWRLWGEWIFQIRKNKTIRGKIIADHVRQLRRPFGKAGQVLNKKGLAQCRNAAKKNKKYLFVIARGLIFYYLR